MTIKMTEDELRNIQWTITNAECALHNVSPMVELDDEDAGGTVVEHPGVSEAYGQVNLSGQPPGGTVSIELNWQTSGDTNGTYADLFDWATPELNVTVGDYGIEIKTAMSVTDEDGDRLSHREVCDIISDVLVQEQGEWEKAAAATLPKPPKPEAVDNKTDDSVLTKIELERDNAADVRFSGEEVATASSRCHEGPRNVRWTELSLFRTAGGKWVCSQVGKSIVQGESDRHAVFIATTQTGLVELVGYGWLAKDLYAEAGIDYAQDIE